MFASLFAPVKDGFLAVFGNVDEVDELVQKKNPFHDALGRFATKDTASAKGTAERLLDGKASLSPTEIINGALKTDAERAEYSKAYYSAQEAFQNKQGTNYKHSVNGDGTGGYTKERLELQKRVLEKVLGDASSFKANPPPPEMVILGGRGGSGKSNFATEKSPELGVYSRKTHLVLDSDAIKELLPEYDPEMAALVHEESSHIFHRAISTARQRGLNVVLDITLRSSPREYMSAFGKAGYGVSAAYMHRPPALAAQSAIERWKSPSVTTDINGVRREHKRGRLVPVSIILGNKDNERHFDRLKGKVKRWKLVDHSGKMGDFKTLEDTLAEAVRKLAQLVFKRNPYHDGEGKFTSKEHAAMGPPKDTDGKTPAEILAMVNSNVKASLTSLYKGTKDFWNDKADPTHSLSEDGLTTTITALQHTGKAKVSTPEGAAAAVAKLRAHYIEKGFTVTQEAKEHGEVSIHHVAGTGDFQVKFAQNLGGVTAKPKATPKLTEDEVNAVMKEVSKELTAVKPLPEALNIAGIKESISNMYGEDNKAYVRTALAYHASGDLNDLMKMNSNGSGAKHNLIKLIQKNALEMRDWKESLGKDQGEMPDVSYLDKKSLVKAEKAMANYNEKARGLLLKSSGELIVGKTGAALTALNPLATAEKALAASGMKPEHVAQVVAAHRARFQTDRAAALAKRAVLADKLVEKFIESGESVGYKGADELDAFHANYRELLGDSQNSNYVISQRKKERLDSMVQQYAEALSAPYDKTLNPKDKELAALKAKGLKEILDLNASKDYHAYGLKDKIKNSENVAKAYGTMEKPKSKEEAESIYAGLNYEIGKAKASSSYMYGGDNLSSKEKESIESKVETLKAKAEVIKAMAANAGFGAMLKSESDLQYEGKKAHVQEYEKYKGVLSGAKIEIIAKVADYAVAKAVGGGELSSAALKGAIESAKSKGIPLKVIKDIIASGKAEADSQMANIGKKATESITSASYSYHMTKALKGDSHQDTLDALKNLQNTTATYAKVAKDADGAVASGQFTANKSIQSQKSLGEAMSKAASVSAQMDARAADFKSVSGTEATTYFNEEAVKYTKLSESTRLALKNYTSSGYKPVNKAVGAFGTARMTGMSPEPLSESIKKSVRATDAAFNETTIGRDMTVRRNMAHKYLAAQLGLPDHVSKMKDSDMSSLVGRVYKETAFSSTTTKVESDMSYSDAVGETGAVALIIRAPKETKGIAIDKHSSNSGEKEIIFARGTTYVIRSVQKAGYDGMRVYVDVIGTYPDGLD